MRCTQLFLSASILAILASTGCGRNSSENRPAASNDGKSGATLKTNGPGARSEFDSKHPQIVVETSLGNITLELDGEKSPITVDNFLAYVNAAAYDQTIVHQVYKNQAIIAGGYTTNLSEIRPRIPIRNEANNGLKNLRGTIAMNRQPDVIDSARSQFFINVADNSALDCRNRDSADPGGYGYCVFGKVVKGMDVVNKIAETPVKNSEQFDQTPVQAVVVNSVRRVR